VNIKDIPTPTLITGGAVVLWLGSFVVRSMNPEFSGGPAADALVATVIAWWAKTRKDANGGKDDLITEVLTKNVLPIVSHSPATATPTPATFPPPPPPKTAAPPPGKPSTPPKQGGLPWG
jgi:hypothetical protein